MLLLHEFPYATTDITAVSAPRVQGTCHTKYRIVLQQYSIKLSIPTNLTLESVPPITRAYSMTLIELVRTPVLGSGVTDPPDISLGVGKTLGS